MKTVHESYLPDTIQGHKNKAKGSDAEFVSCFAGQGKGEIFHPLIYWRWEFNSGITDMYLLILLHDSSKL